MVEETDSLTSDMPPQHDTPEQRIVEMIESSPIHAAPSGRDERDALAPEFSDEFLTRAFAEEQAENLRYVSVWGAWFVWTGQFWKKDETLIVVRRVRALLSSISSDCDHRKTAAALASAKTVAAVERLARADRRLAATTCQWDQDPFKLNTPDGEIDLRTGVKTSNRPRSYCTKITSVAPGGACPLWQVFLTRIFDGDAEMISYVQRVAGYCLTASVDEHALFFAYGTGANGKSVFLSTVAGVLGAYSKTAPIETFTISSMTSHPTELAGLRGARLVSASETEAGRRWKESLVKQLTGGDTIAARFMRQDFFEFKFTGKIIIAGNHAPSLRSVDEAIRRRIHLIPFNVRIPHEERDHQLTDKLKNEWPGILAWMIEGARKWRELGLAPPAAVVSATSEYLEGEDAIGQWLAERCELRTDARAAAGELYQSWKKWADAGGHFVGTAIGLGKELGKRGFDLARDSKGAKARRGLRLLSDYELETEYEQHDDGGSYADDGF